jgi:cold shock CspA family protein
MLQGRVSKFFDEKGYGFITSAALGGDIFVHISAVEGRALAVDDAVEFELGTDPRTGRERAVGVKVIRG